MESSVLASTKPKLGIVAGAGPLPGRILAKCQKDGRPVYVLGLQGHTDANLLTDQIEHSWVRLGASASGFEIMRQAGVEQVVMAGPVKRPSLSELKPDWKTAQWFAKTGTKAFGDDGLLSAIVKSFEALGMAVVGIEDLLDDVLAEATVYGRHEPDELARADIARGFAVAKALGSVDVGQSVVVQQGLVLAVEAIEGTDAMIERAGALRREGVGGVLVKVKKPQQEGRVDLPTIGASTVQQVAAAKFSGIAVEAGGALIMERDLVVETADRAGVFVVGIPAS